ncbi:MAG: hypothetical protein SNJ64_01330, partial [Endomicrobiia bacterium]
MKVLIVNRYMSIYGGAENVVKELSFNLSKLGVKNLVLTLNISEQVKEICKDIEIVISKKNFPYKFRSTDFISTIGILNEFLELRKL